MSAKENELPVKRIMRTVIRVVLFNLFIFLNISCAPPYVKYFDTYEGISILITIC